MIEYETMEEEVAFEAIWSMYPKRAGSNPKAMALAAWRKLHLVDADVLEDAVRRYARFCAATGKVGTEYVMQAAAFFGTRKAGWQESWELPAARPPVGERTYLSPTGKLWEMNGRRFCWIDEAQRARGAFEGQQMNDGTITVFRGGTFYPSREAAEAAMRAQGEHRE